MNKEQCSVQLSANRALSSVVTESVCINGESENVMNVAKRFANKKKSICLCSIFNGTLRGQI